MTFKRVINVIVLTTIFCWVPKKDMSGFTGVNTELIVSALLQKPINVKL